MFEPKFVYLITVIIIAIVSTIYNIFKGTFGNYLSFGGLLSASSQLICAFIMFFFLAGLSTNDVTRVIAWIIVLVLVMLSCAAFGLMIEDLIN